MAPTKSMSMPQAVQQQRHVTMPCLAARPSCHETRTGHVSRARAGGLPAPHLHGDVAHVLECMCAMTAAAYGCNCDASVYMCRGRVDSQDVCRAHCRAQSTPTFLQAPKSKLRRRLLSCCEMKRRLLIWHSEPSSGKPPKNARRRLARSCANRSILGLCTLTLTSSLHLPALKSNSCLTRDMHSMCQPDSAR